MYPNFRVSLPDRIRDLKERYRAMKVVEVVDERIVNKLRGKEAHGSAKRFSTAEYRFMICCCDVLIKLYTLLVLENCGMDREFLLSSLKRAPAWQADFSAARLEQLQTEIGEI